MPVGSDQLLFWSCTRTHNVWSPFANFPVTSADDARSLQAANFEIDVPLPAGTMVSTDHSAPVIGAAPPPCRLRNTSVGESVLSPPPAAIVCCVLYVVFGFALQSEAHSSVSTTGF